MATNPSFQRVRSLIGQDRGLAVLLPEARRLRELDGLLARVLPAGLGGQCRVVAVRNGEALILCGSGGAAARVRSMAPTLARALNTEPQPVDRIKVKVMADWSRADRPEKAGLGRRALTAWDTLEQGLPDGALKAAIDRLLKHHRAD